MNKKQSVITTMCEALAPKMHFPFQFEKNMASFMKPTQTNLNLRNPSLGLCSELKRFDSHDNEDEAPHIAPTGCRGRTCISDKRKWQLAEGIAWG